MSVSTPPPGAPLVAWALYYAGLGLEVFPVRAKNSAPGKRDAKGPLVSQYTATTLPSTIEAWWRRWPNALIGHRLSSDHLILDIDPRHLGDVTWKALRDEVGGWPLTRIHGSGRGVGGHFWFAWPKGVDKLSTPRLNDWARQRGAGMMAAGASGPTGNWLGGIDLLRRFHRYTILPPSPHPETGQAYYWLEGHGLEVEPAELPGLLLQILTTPEPPAAPRRSPGLVGVGFEGDSIADWYCAHHQWPEILEPKGWLVVGSDGESDGSKYRHPAASHEDSASIRHGCLFVYSPNTPFEVTETDEPHGITKFRAYATLYHGGDMSAAARHLREGRDGHTFTARVSDAEMRAMVEGVDTGAGSSSGSSTGSPTLSSVPSLAAPAPPPVLPPELFLPDVVWNSRPVLEHIRTAARARLLPPDAVLGAVLARVAACTPHTVQIPGVVGSAMGLTYYSAVVGDSSAGKSASTKCAKELVPAPDYVKDGLPIGSGEGMVEVLFDMVMDIDPHNGKDKLVKKQRFYNAVFFVDEGESVGQMGKRNGSTLLSSLRTAYTHGVLGQTNASAERNRLLEASNYVYGIVMAIQPEKCGEILGDAGGGTPQRFMWFMAYDPYDGAVPEWPGRLEWTPPDAAQLAPYMGPSPDGYQRAVMVLDPAIRDEVIANRRAANQGVKTEAHRDLRRIKTAACLALLEGRMEVDGEDWALAGLICTTSTAVRVWVEEVLAAVAIGAYEAADNRAVQREARLVETRLNTAQATAARAVGNKVHNHALGRGALTHALDEGCSRRCLQRTITGVSGADCDEAIREAIDEGWMTFDAVSGRFFRTATRPPVGRSGRPRLSG